MKKVYMLFVMGTVVFGAWSHCQIPCGIYGDQARFKAIEEHIATIERSMNKIRELSVSDRPNHNQLSRWVINKEEHAQEIQDIVAEYFLAQRIKSDPGSNKKARAAYLHKLELLHGLIVQAMKAKQTTDATHVRKLRHHLASFEKVYFGKGK